MTDGVPERPRVRDDLVFRQLDEEWVVYDPDGRQLHVLNRSAAAVWLACDGSRTLPEIAAEVREAFDPPPDADVDRDVTQAVSGFADRGLLV